MSRIYPGMPWEKRVFHCRVTLGDEYSTPPQFFAFRSRLSTRYSHRRMHSGNREVSGSYSSCRLQLGVELRMERDVLPTNAATERPNKRPKIPFSPGRSLPPFVVNDASVRREHDGHDSDFTYNGPIMRQLHAKNCNPSRHPTFATTGEHPLVYNVIPS